MTLANMVDTVDILEDLGMIKSGMNVLDIGCFRGYWADTFQAKGYDINYLGLDVSVAQTNRNEQRFKDIKFKFKHLDIFSATYNPLGKFQAHKAKMPVGDSWADLIICHSLFTHLGKFQVAQNYMAEIRRILKPGGYLWITFFISPPNLIDDQSRRTVRTVNTALEVEELTHTFTKLYCNGGETTDYNDQVMMGLQK